MMRYFVFVYCIFRYLNQDTPKKKDTKDWDENKKNHTHTRLLNSIKWNRITKIWLALLPLPMLFEPNQQFRQCSPFTAKIGKMWQRMSIFFRLQKWRERERKRKEFKKSNQQQHIAMKQCYTFQNAMCIFIAKDKIYVAFCSWHRRKKNTHTQQFESI